MRAYTHMRPLLFLELDTETKMNHDTIKEYETVQKLKWTTILKLRWTTISVDEKKNWDDEEEKDWDTKYNIYWKNVIILRIIIMRLKIWLWLCPCTRLSNNVAFSVWYWLSSSILRFIVVNAFSDVVCYVIVAASWPSIYKYHGETWTSCLPWN